MSWIAASVFALGSFGAAALAYTLTRHLEYQPEYSPMMTDAMRAIGTLIAVLGALFGLVLFGYAVVSYAGF